MARWMVLSGDVLKSDAAHALGLVDVVTTRGEVDEVVATLARGPKRSAVEVDREHPTAQAAERLLSDEQVAGWLDGSHSPGEDPYAARLAKRLSHKGPVALQVANKLIGFADRGADVSAGLAAEAEAMRSIFETQDAKAGIRAALSRQRPVFEGR